MKIKYFFGLLFFLVWSSVHAQIFDQARLAAAYTELSGAYNNFDKLRSLVQQIDQGQKPAVASSSNWKPLVDSYLKAASDVQSTPLPTDVDAAQYKVSAGDLGNCYLKDVNFGKLNDFKNVMAAAIGRGNQYLVTLNNMKDVSDRADVAVQYLIGMNQKLMSLPIFTEIFEWNWYDLETAVRPALSTARSAINDQMNKLQAVLKNLNVQKDNLEQNTNLLQHSLCLVEGTYKSSGCFKNWGKYNTPVGMTLTIAKNNETYSGSLILTVTVFGSTTSTINLPVISLTSSQFLSATIMDSGRQVNWKGQLSQNYATVMQFNNGVVTCDLSKQ